jgi:6,7-dimethyl-8-ribityllumazine synthase
MVCNNANHWLMETAIRSTIPLGNAILTVDSHAQALARAAGGSTSGKGGDAARACLSLIALKARLAADAEAMQS